MAGKRGNGEGSIKRLPNTKEGRTRWEVKISAGVSSTGKRKRVKRTCATRADAVIVLRELLEQTAAGTLPPSGTTQSLAQYLKTWLADAVAPERARNTHESYRLAVDKHIIPHLGQIVVSKLTRVNVKWWMARLAEKEVGQRTKQNAFAVLRRAMNHAIEAGAIRQNPCWGIKRPRAPRKKIQPFNRKEANHLLKITRDDREHPIYVVALMLGLRQGELFGLHWTNIDFENETISIEQQVTLCRGKILREDLKTENSRRTLRMPPQVVVALQEQRARLLREGLAASPIVFPGRRGKYLRHREFGRRFWKKALFRAGLNYRGFHHCRHTFATLALGAGVSVPEVASMLGDDQTTTLKSYSHVLPAQQTEANIKITRLFA